MSKELFYNELTNASHRNIYTLLIHVLERCEKLWFNDNKIADSLWFVADIKLPDFKSTLLSWKPRATSVILECILNNSSEKDEIANILRGSLI